MALARRANALTRIELPSSFLPPTFLLPSLAMSQNRTFHVSQCRRKKETNKKRGLSAIRRSGLRKDQTLSVKIEDLPRPRTRSEQQVNEEHGLYKFFGHGEFSITTPEETGSFGRAWTVDELRKHSFEDLHIIWWKCVYEQNRLATQERERDRLKAGYGENEAEQRVSEVQKTMRAIKHALTERWYTWENARSVAKDDPTINIDPARAATYLSDAELREEYALADEEYDPAGSTDLLEEEDPQHEEATAIDAQLGTEAGDATTLGPQGHSEGQSGHHPQTQDQEPTNRKEAFK